MSYLKSKVNILQIFIIAICAAIVSFICCAFTWNAVAEENNNSSSEWAENGYQSYSESVEDLNKKIEETANTYDEFIEKYGDVATDEQKEHVASLAALMNASCSNYLYEQDKAEVEAIKAECENEIAKREAAKAAAAAAYSGGGSYNLPSGDGILTKNKGRNSFNGRYETWYSIHEAGQQSTAHEIPGKHIGDDGIIRDKDGYICVAASDKAAYTVIETSLGTGKVYDNGCRKGVTDIYTAW